MDKRQIPSPGWLLKQDNMALINQCRQYIQREFGTRLLFSQPDLIEQIREYSSHSHNRMLIERVRELENRLNTHQSDAAPLNTEQQRYRGQPVAVASAIPAPVSARPRPPLRIYRGQIVAET